MRTFCREVRKPTMANMVDHGRTPALPPAEPEAIEDKIAAYPLTLLSVAAAAGAREAREALRAGRHPDPRMSFESAPGDRRVPRVLR